MLSVITIALAAYALTGCFHRHKWSEWRIRTYARCESQGVKYCRCSCGEEKTEPIPATGHTPEEEWKNDYDCHWRLCRDCRKEVGKTRHSLDVKRDCSVCLKNFNYTRGLEFELVQSGEEKWYKVSDIPSEDGVVIPTTFEGLPVRSIASDAARVGLRTLILPEGIREIEPKAFYAIALKSISLPQSLRVIGDRAFSGCQLTEVVIPDGVETMGENAFEDCINLKSCKLPNGLKMLPANLFKGCTSLEQVVLPGGLTAIDRNAFNKCWSLSAIELPKSVKRIGAGAFYGCSELKNIDFAHLLTIGEEAFKGCRSLDRVELPALFLSLGDGAFENCSGLTFADLSGVQRVGAYAFIGCSSLQRVIVPKDRTYWEASIFDSNTVIEEFGTITDKK